MRPASQRAALEVIEPQLVLQLPVLLFDRPSAAGKAHQIAERRRAVEIQQVVYPLVVLAAGNEPDFRTVADFRKRHLTALKGFFEQVLRLAHELGAPRAGRVAVEGGKVKANASKHTAMSYDRMREKQRQLHDEVDQLLTRAEAADAADDAQ